MRIALVVHGFPPHERTGVETHVAALAKNLSRRGLSIEVFAPRADPTLEDFAQRREERDGYGLTWVIANRIPRSAAEHLDPPGMAGAFGEFLDRTRPALVHFQHVQKLGVGILEAAARRGIPSIYTAHDYYPVCHRTILARPDLARCTVLGDSRACARCDSAVSYLNGLDRFGDYQAGVLGEALSQAEQRELARLLSAQTDGSAERAILEERARLDQLRNSAFAAVDLVLSPTEFLRRQLIAGGFEPARVELSGYGIETAALTALAPPRDGAKGPLTFGYIGGASKHKGLHVLLEAFGRMQVPARLSIHADSTDRAYVGPLRERARALGADWHGAFAAEALPAVLAGIDVLVVPSIWWENAPFVIREAFAARRPVIASDLPALRESVNDSVDGLLVAPDDAGGLAAAMSRLASHPKLVASFSRNTRTPRSLDDLGDELLARYSALIAKRGKRLPAHVPRSARAFSERVLALESLTVAELAERAADGLSELARSLGVDERAAQPIDARQIALERLHDARREIAWRIERERAQLALLEGAQRSSHGLASELARALGDGDEARAALGRAQAELAARGKELEAAASAQGFAREALELEQRAHAQARAALAGASEALAELERERTQWLALRDELAREASASREAAARAAETSEELAQALRRLEGHANWLEIEALGFVRRFGHAAQALRDDKDVRAAHAVLDRLQHELEWRRSEMRAIREDGGRLIRALIDRSGLGRRMRGWEREP